MFKTIHALIFAFIIGGLVGYSLSTSQALTAAAAVADAVPIPDSDQVEITSPAPMLACPPSQHTANAQVPARPLETYTTQPPATEATGSPLESPDPGPAATGPACLPPPCGPLATAEPTEPTTEPFEAGDIEPATEELGTEPAGAE
jgi:hypothetical protein